MANAKKEKNEYLERLGKRIAEVRKRLGIQQKEVAEILKQFPATILRLEKGEGASIEVLFAYFELLKSKGAYIPALFMDSFDIKVAVPANPNDARALLEISRENGNADIDEFNRHVENILVKQREKSNQSFNELIDLTKASQLLHFDRG